MSTPNVFPGVLISIGLNSDMVPQDDFRNWVLQLVEGRPWFNEAVLNPSRMGSDYNYGMAYLANPSSQDVIGGHISDIGKLPNHPTFSTESVYAIGRQDAGRWAEMPDGSYRFHNPTKGLFFAPEEDAYKPYSQRPVLSVEQMLTNKLGPSPQSQAYLR